MNRFTKSSIAITAMTILTFFGSASLDKARAMIPDVIGHVASDRGETHGHTHGYGECSRCSCPGFIGATSTCDRCGHHYDSHW